MAHNSPLFASVARFEPSEDEATRIFSRDQLMELVDEPTRPRASVMRTAPVWVEIEVEVEAKKRWLSIEKVSQIVWCGCVALVLGTTFVVALGR